jgi:hypothetical protein
LKFLDTLNFYRSKIGRTEESYDSRYGLLVTYLG